jgi:hypothetical protein
LRAKNPTRPIAHFQQAKNFNKSTPKETTDHFQRSSFRITAIFLSTMFLSKPCRSAQKIDDRKWVDRRRRIRRATARRDAGTAH